MTLIEGQTATTLCSINIRHVFDLAPDLTTMDVGLVCMSERDLDPQFHVECQPSQRPIALFTSSSWRRWCHKVLVLFFLSPSLPGAHSFLLTFPRSDSVKRKCNLRRRRWLHRCLLALKRHESSVQYMTLPPIQSSHAQALMQQRTDFHVMVDREGLF